METRTLADPVASYEVRVAAPDNRTVVLHDGIGALDTAIARAGGVVFQVSSLNREVGASADGNPVGTSAVPPAFTARRLLVLGDPDWETKFAIAALEERGWTVDIRVRVAPTSLLGQGVRQQPDTARHDAVIVLTSDVSPNEALRVMRFVQAGGGLVIAAAGNQANALRSIMPARSTFQDAAGSSLRQLAADAVTLSQDGDAIKIAARRERSGLVLQLAGDTTWRVRIDDAAGGVESHRAWWANVVASVVTRQQVPPKGGLHDMQAPLAATTATLGPPQTNLAFTSVPVSLQQLQPFLFALAIMALIAEWASRRLRGAR